MTIGTYTTCDQPKAPFFPWIILGWILHFLLMYVYTRISKYIPEGEEFKAVDLPYGQALKIRVKNKWSISFGDIPLEEPFLKNNKEFTKIGSDAHKHILSHLDAKSLAKSERVSKDWYRLATTPKLWGRFRWARTFNKNVKNKKLLFVKASITLIIVLCFTEVFLQYVLFGYRIKENLPVEPKCVENADFTNYPHNCCSGNFCADVDDSELTDFVVHPCCGAAVGWRSFSCYCMTFTYSFNVVSIVTFVYVITVSNPMPHPTQKLVNNGILGLTILLYVGVFGMAASCFITHFLPGLVLYFWVLVPFFVIFCLFSWGTTNYIDRKDLRWEFDEYVPLVLFLFFVANRLPCFYFRWLNIIIWEFLTPMLFLQL